jgi:hypothetical protein
LIGMRAGEELSAKPARKLRWLPALESELRRRMGWVDEAISPFARRRRAAKPNLKAAVPLSRADTLLFPSGERKSA